MEVHLTKIQLGNPNLPVKLCFMTVGATASFSSLVREVLSVDFLTALQKQRYTHLLVQYGSLGYDIFDELKREHGLEEPKEQFGIAIEGFDFNVEGLMEEMIAVRTNPRLNRLEGMIISHAGMISCRHCLKSAADENERVGHHPRSDAIWGPSGCCAEP